VPKGEVADAVASGVALEAEAGSPGLLMHGQHLFMACIGLAQVDQPELGVEWGPQGLAGGGLTHAGSIGQNAGSHAFD
jgi:hypothetical protein